MKTNEINKLSTARLSTPPFGGGREGLYIAPTVEIIEVETMESIMQYSGGRMNDVEVEDDKSSWSGIKWD